MPTGIAHGTVTVIADRVPYEVTTLRRDVETHGRHATVAFTDDWAADARRRDFTINALYCSADGEVFDPLGGAPDIEARRVRFIGDAARAHPRGLPAHPALLPADGRIWRRRARCRGRLPPACSSATASQRLSAERVRQEMLRLLVAPRGPELVRAMLDYGFLPLVLGLAPRPTLLQRLADLEAALAREPDAMLRLAALAVEVPEDASRLAERLRLSNDERERLARVAAHTPTWVSPSRKLRPEPISMPRALPPTATAC